jgi:hypothetical protein
MSQRSEVILRGDPARSSCKVILQVLLKCMLYRLTNSACASLMSQHSCFEHALLEPRVELVTRQHRALLLLHAMLSCQSLQASAQFITLCTAAAAPKSSLTCQCGANHCAQVWDG